MKVSIDEAKANFLKLIQYLVDQKEDLIIISDKGKPLVKMALFENRDSKRIGIANDALKGHDLSLEEFNSIEVDGFKEYL